MSRRLSVVSRHLSLVSRRKGNLGREKNMKKSCEFRKQVIFEFRKQVIFEKLHVISYADHSV